VRSLVIALVLISALVPSTVRAQARCGHPDPEISISVCSGIIQSGRAKGRDLAVAHTERGIAYVTLLDYDRALLDFGEAIRIDPSFARAFANRGAVYGAKQDFEKALADFSRVLTLEPRSAQPLFDLVPAKPPFERRAEAVELLRDQHPERHVGVLDERKAAREAVPEPPSPEGPAGDEERRRRDRRHRPRERVQGIRGKAGRERADGRDRAQERAAGEGLVGQRTVHVQAQRASRPHERRQRAHGRRRIRDVVHDAEAVNEIERIRRKGRTSEVGLHEVGARALAPGGHVHRGAHVHPHDPCPVLAREVQPAAHPAAGVEHAQGRPRHRAVALEIPAEDVRVDVEQLGEALPFVAEERLGPAREGIGRGLREQPGNAAGYGESAPAPAAQDPFDDDLIRRCGRLQRQGGAAGRAAQVGRELAPHPE